LIIVAIAVFAAVGVIGCVILEERGRPEVIVLVILSIVVFDALVYPDGGAEPPGILRPTIMGHDYRTADLVIVLALVARLLARGLPRRVTGTGIAWTAFFAMFVLAAPIGLANGHDSVLVIFQTKFVLEAGGMAILMAGVPLARVTSPEFVGKAAWILGLASVIPIATAFANRTISLPLLPEAGFGSDLGADTATVLLSLAFLLLLVELCHRTPRPGVCAWCGLMIISAIVTGQRAALIGMAATLACALIVVIGRPWKRRSSARLSHLLPVVALLLIPLGTLAVLDARTSPSTSSVPVVSSITGSFTGVGKTQSANIRLRVWSLGRHLAEQRPLFGWGLGQNFTIFQDNGSEDPFTGGDFHDIAIDLTVTTGLAGFGLFLLALAASLGSAFATWRNARDSAYAAAALAAGIVLVQLVAKGLVESVTQKYRLALVFGLFIGVIAQAARSETADVVEPQRSEPVWI
jgi:O-antigen ligase